MIEMVRLLLDSGTKMLVTLSKVRTDYISLNKIPINCIHDSRTSLSSLPPSPFSLSLLESVGWKIQKEKDEKVEELKWKM